MLIQAPGVPLEGLASLEEVAPRVAPVKKTQKMHLNLVNNCFQDKSEKNCLKFVNFQCTLKFQIS